MCEQNSHGHLHIKPYKTPCILYIAFHCTDLQMQIWFFFESPIQWSTKPSNKHRTGVTTVNNVHIILFFTNVSFSIYIHEFVFIHMKWNHN